MQNNFCYISAMAETQHIADDDSTNQRQESLQGNTYRMFFGVRVPLLPLFLGQVSLLSYISNHLATQALVWPSGYLCNSITIPNPKIVAAEVPSPQKTFGRYCLGGSPIVDSCYHHLLCAVFLPLQICSKNYFAYAYRHYSVIFILHTLTLYRKKEIKIIIEIICTVQCCYYLLIPVLVFYAVPCFCLKEIIRYLYNFELLDCSSQFVEIHFFSVQNTRNIPWIVISHIVPSQSSFSDIVHTLSAL